jgi:hypothetical protein
MSFRVSALIAFALALGSAAPALAQPQAPLRPRTSPFGSVFTPGPAGLAPQGGGVFGFNRPAMVGPALVGGVGGPLAPGFFYPNQALAYPQVLPGAYGINPLAPTTGVVGTFNNLGHWYGPRSGYYGHWYPNGVASGAGVVGIGGGFGYAPTAIGPTVGGGFGRPVNSLLGTTLMGGAAANQFRR